MASFNRVVLVGNLTRDPEIRYIPSGMAVTDIGLAVNDRRKDPNGGWIEEVTFVDITVWGRNAEILSEYTRKGSQILVEGRLKMDSWEQEGQKRSRLKVVAERTVLLGNRAGSSDGGGASAGQGYNKPGVGGRPYGNTASSYEEQLPPDAPSDNDIPF